jgi:hypothetical protein
MNVFGKKLAEQGIENERIRYYGQKEHCYIGIATVGSKSSGPRAFMLIQY